MAVREIKGEWFSPDDLTHDQPDTDHDHWDRRGLGVLQKVLNNDLALGDRGRMSDHNSLGLDRLGEG